MRYFLNVFKEFGNISWLKPISVIYLSTVVIIVAILVGFALGFLDRGIGNALESAVIKAKFADPAVTEELEE